MDPDLEGSEKALLVIDKHPHADFEEPATVAERQKQRLRGFSEFEYVLTSASALIADNFALDT